MLQRLGRVRPSSCLALARLSWAQSPPHRRPMRIGAHRRSITRATSSPVSARPLARR